MIQPTAHDDAGVGVVRWLQLLQPMPFTPCTDTCQSDLEAPVRHGAVSWKLCMARPRTRSELPWQGRSPVGGTGGSACSQSRVAIRGMTVEPATLRMGAAI